MGPAQPCGSIHVFQGTGLGKDSLPLSHALTPANVWRLPLYPESDSNRSPSLPRSEHLSPPLILLFIISSVVCYASSLCLSNTHSNMTSNPSSFPPPGTFSSVYSSKLHFPNKVKLPLQRLCAQLFHTQYGSPASFHVVQEYCLQGTHVPGIVLTMF